MPPTLDPPRPDVNLSALDIALEDVASGLGLPFLPDPPPPPPGAPTLLGVAALDRRLRFRRIDAALAAANGLTVEEHLGRTVAEAAPALAAALGPALRRAVETGEPLLSAPLDRTVLPPPEGRRWLASLFPLPPDPEAIRRGRGGPAGVVAVVREVDEELTLRPRGVSDERFRELLVRSTVGLAQVDRRGRFLYVNDRFCEMTGWTRDELAGVRRLRDVTHPHDADRAGAQFARALRTGEPYLTDQRLRRPDGRSVWVRNAVTVLPGADGRAESLFAVAVDLTDRMRTQRALARSERRLRLAAEAGGVGVWSFDLKQGTADWSPEALAIFGGGFEGRPTLDQLRERIHPDDRDLLDGAESAPEGGGPARIDVTHRVVHPPDPGAAGEGPAGETRGAVRWVRALGERWFDDAGRPVRSAGVLRDVTADRTAAARLADSESRLRLAAGAAQLGLYELDLTTEELWWDDRCRAIFDYEPGRGGTGRHADDGTAIPLTDGMGRIAPDDAPAVADSIAAARAEAERGGGPVRIHLAYRVVRRDGTHTHVRSDGEVRVEPGVGGRPDTLRVIGCLRDVTAEVERERRLAANADRLNLAAEAAGLGAYDVDLRTETLWWDERIRALYGVPDAAETVPLAEAFACVHPEDRASVEGEMAAAHAPDGPPRFHYEFRVRRPDGSIRWIRAHGVARFEGTGGTRTAVRQIGYVQDVTAETRRAEADAARAAELAARAAQIAATEERRRLAAATAELGAFDFDPRGKTVWWDERARELFDLPGDQQALGTVLARIHPRDRPGVAAGLEAALAGRREPRYLNEYRVVAADGRTRWIRGYNEVQFADRPDGGGREAVRLVGCLQDVTERKGVERALAEAKLRLETENDRLEAAVADRTAELRRKHAQLRAAAERIGEVGRQERDRIAHVLHDHLQQILVGAKMNLSVLTATVGDESRAQAGYVAELVDEAINESRSLSAELSPPVLRGAGLAPALAWLADQFDRRHGLAVEVNADDDASAALDDSLAALLFGAARECLLNVVKHAHAPAARVRFERTACGAECGGPECGGPDLAGSPFAGPRDGRAGVRLTVADDGAGFDAAAAAGKGAGEGAGFGMQDLRQRVDLLDGGVTVRSAPGAGCTVEVCVPLPNAPP